VKSEQRNVKRCDVALEFRMTTHKSVGRLHASQETATNCGYVGLFANKYIVLNHERNIIGN